MQADVFEANHGKEGLRLEALGDEDMLYYPILVFIRIEIYHKRSLPNLSSCAAFF